MDFYLSEEQELIRSAMREFAEEHVAPIAQEIDESSRWPADLYVKLGEKGWMGMPFFQNGSIRSAILSHVRSLRSPLVPSR